MKKLTREQAAELMRQYARRQLQSDIDDRDRYLKSRDSINLTPTQRKEEVEALHSQIVALRQVDHMSYEDAYNFLISWSDEDVDIILAALIEGEDVGDDNALS